MNKDFDINNNLERKFSFSYQWFSSGDKEQDKILRKTLEKLPDNISSILLSFIDKHKNTKQWDELKTPFFQFVQNFLKTNNFNFLNQISPTYPEFGEMKNQISNYPNLKSGYYPHDTVTINPGGFKIEKDIVTPKAPSIGKTLFSNTDIQEWANGDSWARKHPQEIDFSAGLSINSNLTPKQISELQTNPKHPQEIDFKLQGETGIKYKSKTLDIYLKAKAGGAFRGENTDQGLDFIKQYSQIPSKIINLADEIRNFAHNPDIGNIQSSIKNITQTIQKISSGDYSKGTINLLTSQINQLQTQSSQINQYFQQSEALLLQGNLIANQLKDGTHKTNFELAAGAEGALDVAGHIPIGKDTTLSLKGSLIYISNNPYYNPQNKDSLQPEYLLASLRMDAMAILKGTDHLKSIFNDLDRLKTNLQTLSNLTTSALSDIQGQISSGDINQIKQGLENIIKDFSASSSQPISQLQQSAASILNNLNNLEKNLEIGLDMKTTMVTPTQNFGFGVGAGLSQDIHLKNKNPLLPKEMNLTVSADNITGYLPGKEEVRQLDIKKLIENKQISFKLLREENRNVYKDFFPPTYRAVINFYYPKGPAITAGWEKIDGIPGVTSYYGLSQRVGKHTQIQAGLLHDGPQNTDLKVFKLMQGHKNSQFSVTFAADSIELSKAKNFSIFSGIKWEF